MQVLDLSLIVKTFIRPDCLQRFLESVKIYQNKWQVKFADVVVIDDGDEESRAENKQIVARYEDLHISYYSYDFNALGLCKGRNEGLRYCSSKYFVCCDDDFMLDLDCDIAANLQTLQQHDLDILGGYYRNVVTADAIDYQPDNWIGFIREGEKEDFCSIYSDVFPEFVRCDIVENFFIGVTESVRNVGYPEDIPIKEHNLVFLRFKQAGIKVAMTNKLFVRHYHTKAKRKNYGKFRHQQVVNPIDKKVYGVLVQKDKIFKFEDYLYVAKVKYVPKENLLEKIKRKIKRLCKK